MISRLGLFFAVLALVLAGCGSDDAPDPTSILGPNGEQAGWSLDVRSDDGMVMFSQTPLLISSNASGYTTAWMSDTPNGSATFNTNTLTITMDISHTSGDLDLVGVLNDNDFMSGSGTISGYQGARVVSWNATRD